MNAPVRPAPLSRRTGLKVLALAGLGLGAPLLAPAADQRLPLSASLPDELARALQARQPLVVMVSLHRCPWCDEVRSNYLAPMHAQDGLPVVQVDMLSPRATRSAGGQETSHAALVRAWDVKVAPTLLFLGRGGTEVADRLVGGASDFYAAYLDRRLEQARQALR